MLNHLPTTMLLNTSLSAKLQSPSNRIDLQDRRMARGAGSPRPNPAPCLNPSENLDMIVEQTLEELGMHTLRVKYKALRSFSCVQHVCVYEIALIRAIRPCHPSQSMPLTLALVLLLGRACVCVCVCVCIY